MAADPTSQVPVVIAGAGPAGLVAAVTLARNGVRSLLVERDQGLSPLPRATAVSTRTMELLRSWGLEDQVRASQLDLNSTGAWAAETLASPDGVELPLGVAGIEQAAAASPTTLAAVPQDHLEPVLLGHLETLGLTEIQFGTELTALGQDAGGVTVTLRQRAGGAERAVRAAYLVRADGAHSAARRLLGIAMDGPDHLTEQLTVLFEAPLGEVVGDRRHGIYFIQHPEAGGVLVPNGAGDRWLYGRGWDPPRERLEDYTDARLTGLIRAAAGVGDLPVRVVARGAFSFAAQVAERYREGRAFLAGDAAQRMTPRGGMGMNTAVAEAHDLAWKLAWVLNGWAGPGLLGSYEAEWRPIGARRTARSAKEGAEPDGAEALAEDLNGRLPHAWVPSADGHSRSTLDLLGPGLTLLIGPGPGAGAWPGAAATLDTPFPLTVHTLDPATATALGVDPDGAILARPDAQVVAHWPSAPANPAAALSTLASAWSGGQPAAGGLTVRLPRSLSSGGVRPWPERSPVATVGLSTERRAGMASIELWWLPLGAGGRFVRLNGRVYEAVRALLERRRPLDLYHCALEVRVPEGRFVIENAWPIPDAEGPSRGVVVEGPVASRRMGRLRVFRYEVRRWRDGVIADAGEAVASPRRLSDDPLQAHRLLELVGSLPTPVWGRDELGTGEMWNSNAVVAWLLARAGLPVDDITPPPGGRAPGWQAGLITARRQQQDDLQQQVEVVGGHLRLAKDRGQRPLRERSSMQGDNDREMPLMTSQLAVTALDAGLDKTGSFQRPDDLSRSRDGRKLGHPGMRTSTNASSGFASISGTGLSSK